MIRRNNRLRQEYIFRRTLNSKERVEYEKKRAIKSALDEGKPIPTELRNEYDTLKASIDADDMDVEDPGEQLLDDEYALAGVQDPKVWITTSRDCTQRLIQFSKEMRLVIPNAIQINRGRTKVGELVEVARAQGFTDLIILHEHGGTPDGMVVCHLPYGPTAYFGLSDVSMRHDLSKEQAGHVKEQYPHLIFHNFSTPLGVRVSNILKFLFPVPKPETRRVVSLLNEHDFIMFRHHMYKTQRHDEVELTEVGPRFTMRLYQIKLGTMENRDADVEWVLKPYMNTSRKRDFL